MSELLGGQRDGIRAIRSEAFRIARDIDESLEGGRDPEVYHLAVVLGVPEHGDPRVEDLDGLIAAFKRWRFMVDDNRPMEIASEAEALKRWIEETNVA